MIKRIFGELPHWAQGDNPLLRYELFRRQDKTQISIGRIAMSVFALSALILGGHIFATNGLQRDVELPYTLELWRILIFPIIFIQIIIRVAGLSFGVGAVTDERQRQTWDNLRATEHGADIGLRTRFVSVFYRLKGMLFTVMLARFILVAGVLYELTAFQGDYLDLLTARAIPTVSAEIGVIILAAFLTAFIMMPLTATAVDIALGLLISTAVRNRATASLLQILFIIFRVVSAIALTWFTWKMLGTNLESAGLAELYLLGAGGIFADWGLMLSQLANAEQIWMHVPYTVFLGLAMLIAVLIQVAIAEGLLSLSVRLAEFRE